MRQRKPAPGAIVILGDINVDVIGRVKAWPAPGDDCLAPHLEMHCGGVGANAAFALARWGVPTRLAGCIGEDEFGTYLLRGLRNAGVDVRWVQRTAKAMTGMVYVNVTRDGQRTFFGSRGANQVLGRIDGAARLLQGAAGALLMGYDFLHRGPERARGGWIALDLGMAPSQKIPRKILQVGAEMDILFINDEEAKALLGTREPRAAFRALRGAGAREVVMKVGRQGCVIAEGGGLRRVPSFAVRTVDSTGAGDAFVAAYLQARLRGWPDAEAALAANAAGAAAAAFVGAGARLPGARAVAALMRRQRLGKEWDTVRERVLERLQHARGTRRRRV